MEAKVCCKCGEELPLEKFYKDKKKKSGYTSRCKLCLSVVDKHVILEKKCSKCKQELVISCFSKDRAKKSGRASQCKKCMSEVKEYVVPEKKLCRGCNKELEISQFFKDKTKKSGHSSGCKACRSSNREANKKARKKYLESDKGKQKTSEYREKTKDTRKEKNREWIKKKRQNDPGFSHQNVFEIENKQVNPKRLQISSNSRTFRLHYPRTQRTHFEAASRRRSLGRPRKEIRAGSHHPRLCF
ncbi:endonuclease VII [Melbournevirus]|uniref:endonuclease VII n=1 Tax=Melbournevirus TaxID=1560514 RepID=UPI00051F5319|nr:endonuclease VII [Melbournevirus]